MESLSASQTALAAIPPLPSMHRQSTVDRLTEHLAELIRSKELPVNSRLPSELDLANRFGVARTVVREALGHLKALGLVESHSGRGNFVKASFADAPLLVAGFNLRQLHEVRNLLEVHTAGAAAGSRTSRDLEHMAELLKKMESTRSESERAKLNYQYHVIIAEAAGNTLLTQMIVQLSNQIEIQSTYVASAERAAHADAEHSEIFDAISRGDSDAARVAMTNHLRAVYLETESRLKPGVPTSS